MRKARGDSPPAGILGSIRSLRMPNVAGFFRSPFRRPKHRLPIRAAVLSAVLAGFLTLGLTAPAAAAGGGPRTPAEPPFLFNSGTPATDPYDLCGDCYAWSSTYYSAPAEFDLTARRFSVPAGSYTHAIRLWWSYGSEGPHDPIRNHGGDAGDFTGIYLDLYEVAGDGSPGNLITTLDGDWVTLNAQTHYKEYQLVTPYLFAGTDYFLSLRAETPLIGYDAVVLWHACAPHDEAIDYENALNTVWSTGGWDPYTTDNRPYNPCPQDMDFGLQVLGFLVPEGVDAIPADPCVKDGCVTVAFDWHRIDTTPARGYSVTFDLTDNLRLCLGDPDNIRESTYLSRIGNTSFQVIENLDGTYTVDCAILGLPCGATGTGTLFTIKVEKDPLGSEGPASVEILSTIARDCLNGPVAMVPGSPASMVVDTVAPDAVADLSALQIKTGNNPPPPDPPSEVTSIEVSFTIPADAEVVEIYRAPFGNYPEYDDGPNPGAEPAVPSYPPPLPWTRLSGLTGSPHLDHPQTRDFWYYVVFTKDACGNVSVVSNRTTGTLNYHLGDVSKGVPPLCSGNNRVFVEDLSLLGDRYGLTEADPDFLPCVDVGPTTDFTVDARPTTDNQIDFEDLMVFATNFNQVSLASPPAGTELAGGPALSGAHESAAPRLFLRPSPAFSPASPPESSPAFSAASMPASSPAEQIFELVLQGGAGLVKGTHAVVRHDPRIMALSGVDKGPLVESLGSAAAFFDLDRPDGAVVDLAMLGSGSCLPEDGVLAVLRYRFVGASRVSPNSSGAWVPRLTEWGLRDSRNRPLGGASSSGTVSAAGSLASDDTSIFRGQLTLLARPNPFAGRTELRLSLPSPGAVHVAVYDVSGRKVRGIAAGRLEGGEHTWVWDGRDDSGRSVAPGIYLCTARAGGTARTVKLHHQP